MADYVVFNVGDYVRLSDVLDKLDPGGNDLLNFNSAAMRRFAGKPDESSSIRFSDLIGKEGTVHFKATMTGSSPFQGIQQGIADADDIELIQDGTLAVVSFKLTAVSFAVPAANAVGARTPYLTFGFDGIHGPGYFKKLQATIKRFYNGVLENGQVLTLYITEFSGNPIDPSLILPNTTGYGTTISDGNSIAYNEAANEGRIYEWDIIFSL